MAAGLKVYNEDGTLRDKVDSRFPQLLKIVKLPTSGKGWKGVVDVPELANIPEGFKVFHFITMSDVDGTEWPEIRIDGTEVHYSYEFYNNPDIGWIYGENAIVSSNINGDYINLVLGICPYV